MPSLWLVFFIFVLGSRNQDRGKFSSQELMMNFVFAWNDSVR